MTVKEESLVRLTLLISELWDYGFGIVISDLEENGKLDYKWMKNENGEVGEWLEQFIKDLDKDNIDEILIMYAHIYNHIY